MPDGGKALRGMLKAKDRLTPVLHLYYCKTADNSDVRFIEPKDVRKKYHVGDATSLQEWWALDVPKMRHVVIEVFHAECEDHIDMYGKSCVLANEIDYKVLECLPDTAPEIMFDKDIFREYDIRTILAFADDYKFKKKR